MRGPGNHSGYPPGGLSRSPGRKPYFPVGGPAGFTWDSIYLFDEASGALDDKVGAVDLNGNGTPTYNTVVHGRRGILYDAGNDCHAVDDVHIPGSTSFMAFAVCTAADNLSCIMGGYDSGSADPGWIVYRGSGDNKMTIDFRETGAGQLVLASTAIADWTAPILVSVQVDRAANTLRARVTPKGQAGQALSGSIAGFGAFSDAEYRFGFGGLPFLQGGAWLGYAGIRIHAGTEGATKLADLHRILGWE